MPSFSKDTHYIVSYFNFHKFKSYIASEGVVVLEGTSTPYRQYTWYDFSTGHNPPFPLIDYFVRYCTVSAIFDA